MSVLELRYGATRDRVVRLEYGLRDVKTDWEPREAATWARSPTGIEDAAVVGGDFTLEATAQFVPIADKDLTNATPISGPDSWSSFLDWARDKRPFRLVPDATFPDFWVENCYLISPISGLGINRTPSERDVSFKIRNATIDLLMALKGLIFAISPDTCFVASAQDPVSFSLWRDSKALYLNEDGTVGEALAHELRDKHYDGGVRGVLVESKATNLIENGDYETDAAGSGGRAGATAVRDTTQFRHGVASLKVSNVNATQSGVTIVKRDTSRIVAVPAVAYSLTMDVYAPAASVGKLMRLGYEWWNSTPASISQVSGSSIALVLGWQRLSFTATSPAATAFIVPFLETPSAQGVFDVWVDLACCISRAYVMQPIPTNTGQVTRDDDRYARVGIRLSMAMDWTIYLEILPEHGNLASWPDTEPNLDPGTLALSPVSVDPDGDPSNVLNLRLHRQNGANTYEWEYGPNSPTASRTFTPSTSVQKLVMRHYASDHHLDLAIDGSAFVASAAPAFQAWEALTLLRFYGVGFSELAGDLSLRRIKAATGLRTQAQMEAL